MGAYPIFYPPRFQPDTKIKLRSNTSISNTITSKKYKVRKEFHIPLDRAICLLYVIFLLGDILHVILLEQKPMHQCCTIGPGGVWSGGWCLLRGGVWSGGCLVWGMVPAPGEVSSWGVPTPGEGACSGELVRGGACSGGLSGPGGVWSGGVPGPGGGYPSMH